MGVYYKTQRSAVHKTGGGPSRLRLMYFFKFKPEIFGLLEAEFDLHQVLFITSPGKSRFLFSILQHSTSITSLL